MNQSEIALIAEGFAPVVRDFVEKATAPLIAQIETLQTRCAELAAICGRLSDSNAGLVQQINERVDDKLATVKDGAPGRSITVADVEPIIAEAVARAVDAIPRPKDGESVDAAVVEAMVADHVGRAVALIPAPAPGRDADPEVIRSMVAEAVAAIPPAPAGKDVDPAEVERMVVECVTRAVADMPKPEDGAPGQSVTVEDVTPLIEETVARAVAALPPAEPGRSVTVAEIEPIVAAVVAEAVAAMPKPKDGEPGRSVTLDDVAPIVREAVDTAVAALPPARDGAPGKLPLVEDWTDRVYQDGEVVTLDGATWQAQRLTGKAPPHEDWRCIARPGRDGRDGRALNLRSTWSPDETYAALDVVTLDGGAFVARRDAPGPCPGDGWMLLVQRGKAGKPGFPGAKGDPGRRGEAGPAVCGIEIDDTGMVTLRNSDGSTVEHDFAPVLSRLLR